MRQGFVPSLNRSVPSPSKPGSLLKVCLWISKIAIWARAAKEIAPGYLQLGLGRLSDPVPYLDRLACDVCSGINRGGVPQAASYTLGVFSLFYEYPLVRFELGVEEPRHEEATTAD